jgi:uncharacterized peroxidase-related enzyme
MPLLPSIEPGQGVPQALARFKNGTQVPMLRFHEALMRGESPFSVAERELMAAYVSGVNSCSYCYGAHAAVAERFGMPPQLLAGLLDDLGKAEIDEKLKPVLAYVRKLTLTPTRMTQADADAVFAAGWSEQALYDAIQVCCLFNFMNRFVEGIGLEMTSEQLRLRGAALQEHGYVGMIEALQLDT